MNQPKKRRFNPKLKLILIGGLIVIALAVSRYGHLQEHLNMVLMGVKRLGWLAPVAYIAIYNLATLLFVPGSILTLKGGCLFGLFWGAVYVLIGAMLGAILAFGAGRYLSRDWVSQQMAGHPKFQALDEALKREGWKIVLLTRLSPVFPFNLLNYALGVTQVSLRDYVLGSLGMIPATVMYVYIGSLARDLTAITMSDQSLSREAQLIQWVIRGVGALATVAVTVYTARLAQKTLNQRLWSVEVTQSTSRNHDSSIT
jgi:uncharacterized membrane protein YdjX (TVP38/TMEM64 family)